MKRREGRRDGKGGEVRSFQGGDVFESGGSRIEAWEMGFFCGGYIPRCTFRPHLKTMRRPRSLPSTTRHCLVPFPPPCSIHGHSFATIRLDGQPS